jgi:ubiquitin-protein ligase
VWFDAYNDRYERELESLNSRGLEFSVNESAKEQGMLQLAVRYPFDDRFIDLTVDYPDLFPYAPPEVNAPAETFSRHQHPQGGNLCLIGRDSSQWNSEDTIGELLEQRLEPILDYERTHDPDVIKDREEPQGEPISEYFNGFGLLGSYALYDSRIQVPAGEVRGRIEARYSLDRNHEGTDVVHMAIHRILGANGAVLHETAAFDEMSFRGAIKFPWFRLPTNPSGSIEAIHSMVERQEAPLNQLPSVTKRQPRHFFALIYDEEIQQFEFADGISVFERRFIQKGKKLGRRTLPIRTFRAGIGDLAARIPSVASLKDRKALLVGAGAIGSDVAVQLARNGIGTLTLLDGDFVEPATTRRWALGVQAYGSSKVYALRDHLKSNYPQTTVVPLDLKVGSPRGTRDTDQFAQLVELISEHDVIIDLAADLTVSHVLSDLSRLHDKPYVLGNATPGAWGGMVYQWIPNQNHSCWMCLRQQLYGGWTHLPPTDPAGQIQPPGCAARTFTGTSFDLCEISLELMRVVSGIWNVDGGYPPTNWQLGICKLRADDGARLPANWEQHDVTRRPACACGTAQ